MEPELEMLELKNMEEIVDVNLGFQENAGWRDTEKLVGELEVDFPLDVSEARKIRRSVDSSSRTKRKAKLTEAEILLLKEASLGDQLHRYQEALLRERPATAAPSELATTAAPSTADGNDDED